MKLLETQKDTKICNNCKIEKLTSEFRDKGKTLSPYCRECEPKMSKQYREKNPFAKSRSKEYSRVQKLKTYYNISKREYDNLYSGQNGKCAICGTPESELKKSLCVDHDHKTGKVRGLLCVLCNQGLGSFKDNQSNIENALYYLILHK